MKPSFWRFCITGVIAAATVGVPAASQERSVAHHSGSATVSVNDPRPLAQAVIAIRQEYGWQVDYEDPPWLSNSDLRGISPPAWLAAHPGMRGAVVPAGGAFQSTYPESPDMWSSASEELAVLEKIVSDYNASGNPGRFVVRAQEDGSYAVIGISSEGVNGGQVAVRPYLDTVVSIPRATRSADNTVGLILSAVSAKTGIVGRQGGMGTFRLMDRSMITVGGNDEPARDLLMQVSHAMGLKMVWGLWYLPDLQKYALRFHPVALAVPGPFGRRRLVPIGPAPGTAPGGP